MVVVLFAPNRGSLVSETERGYQQKIGVDMASTDHSFSVIILAGTNPDNPVAARCLCAKMLGIPIMA